jgi:hypothetical protein
MTKSLRALPARENPTRGINQKISATVTTAYVPVPDPEGLRHQ